MSRLLHHKRKKALIYLAIILIVAFAIFTVGFKLIINGSVYIANMFGNKTDTGQYQNETLAEININEIPSATNSSQLKISGNTYNIDSIIIFLNNEEIKTLSISSKNEFSALIDNLVNGENKVYFVGEVKNSSKRKKTDTYSIVSKTSKPKIEVSSPSDNLITPKSEIRIVGQTDPNVSLRIGGFPTSISSTGNFDQSVQLKDGENKIIITAEDEAGNSEELTLTIIYEK
ncbi:MAG: hypothetical protein ABH812_03665 [bacterium]